MDVSTKNPGMLLREMSLKLSSSFSIKEDGARTCIIIIPKVDHPQKPPNVDHPLCMTLRNMVFLFIQIVCASRLYEENNLVKKKRKKKSIPHTYIEGIPGLRIECQNPLSMKW